MGHSRTLAQLVRNPAVFQRTRKPQFATSSDFAFQIALAMLARLPNNGLTT